MPAFALPFPQAAPGEDAADQASPGGWNSYYLYSLTFFLIILATVLYFTRSHWLPQILPADTPAFFPFNYIRYTRLGSISRSGGDGDDASASFAADAAGGLHSSTFDLSGNIEAGDSRAGLDDRAKQEIRRLMKQRRLTFDEARRQVVLDRFRREGIGPDGRPRDPKFVSFS